MAEADRSDVSSSIDALVGMQRPEFELDTFSRTPLELIEFLDDHAIGQDEAKRDLARTIVTHYRRLRKEAHQPDAVKRVFGVPKTNILLAGPTGVGKTFIVNLASYFLGVPMAYVSATSITEAGYVGSDVEDACADLLLEAGGDIELAQRGIIFIDEVDKIAAKRVSGTRDVSGEGVQEALLPLLHGSKVELSGVKRLKSIARDSSLKFDTRDVFFVMAGAFTRMPDVIRARLTKSGEQMGFKGTPRSDAEYSQLPPERADFVSYGLLEEFVGRVATIANLRRLTEEQLYQALVMPNCGALHVQRENAAAYDRRVLFQESALRAVARQAAQHEEGARSLHNIVDSSLSPFMTVLPDTEVRTLTVTEQMIENTEQAFREFSGIYPATVRGNGSEPEDLWHAEVSREEAYKARLGNTGRVMAGMLNVATQYGILHNIPPEAMPNIISAINGEIDRYIVNLHKTTEVQIEFDQGARDQIIGQALHEGTLYVSDLLHDHIGRTIEREKHRIPGAGERVIPVGVEELQQPARLYRQRRRFASIRT